MKVGVEGGRMETTTSPRPGVVSEAPDAKGDLGMHGNVEDMATAESDEKKVEHCCYDGELDRGQLGSGRI